MIVPVVFVRCVCTVEVLASEPELFWLRWYDGRVASGECVDAVGEVTALLPLDSGRSCCRAGFFS